jgi:hypothetical protein
VAPQAPITLKATIKMTVARIDTPVVRDEQKPTPFGNFGPLLMQLLTPEGPVDIEYIIAGDETRADVQGRLATLPRGSVVLQKMGDESIRVMNPATRRGTKSRPARTSASCSAHLTSRSSRPARPPPSRGSARSASASTKRCTCRCRKAPACRRSFRKTSS